MKLSEYKKLSKFLSLILRHKPELIGLEIDENGWANVDELINLINKNKTYFNFEVLEEIVRTNDKQRFTFSNDKKLIRASQGHSIEINLGYKSIEPPKYLYHGTSVDNITLILEQGIKKMSRSHVHLSSEIETANKVGKRHGRPIILKVKALEMFSDGYDFYLSDNKVWLTEYVPFKYLMDI